MDHSLHRVQHEAVVEAVADMRRPPAQLLPRTRTPGHRASIHRLSVSRFGYPSTAAVFERRLPCFSIVVDSVPFLVLRVYRVRLMPSMLLAAGVNCTKARFSSAVDTVFFRKSMRLDGSAFMRSMEWSARLLHLARTPLQGYTSRRSTQLVQVNLNQVHTTTKSHTTTLCAL